MSDVDGLSCIAFLLLSPLSPAAVIMWSLLFPSIPNHYWRSSVLIAQQRKLRTELKGKYEWEIADVSPIIVTNNIQTLSKYNSSCRLHLGVMTTV